MWTIPHALLYHLPPLHVFGLPYPDSPWLVGLHNLSDFVIGVSYVAISATLAWLVYRARRAIPFSWMFLAFGAFILGCGISHFMHVVTVWHPEYWPLLAVAQAVTVVASFVTATLLPPLVPQALALLESARLFEGRKGALQRANAALETQIAEHARAREALRASEARQRTILAALHEGVVLHDDTGQIVEANPAAERLLGLTGDQLRGLTARDPRWGALREGTVKLSLLGTDGGPKVGNDRRIGDRIWLVQVLATASTGSMWGGYIQSKLNVTVPRHEAGGWQAAHQPRDLLDGHGVGILVRVDAAHIHGRGPALTGEADLGQPLVRPPGNDGLPGGMTGRMIIEATLGARRRVAAGPDAAIDRIDRLAVGERLGGEQHPQPGLVAPPMDERGVQAAPAAPMHRLAAQVDRRRHRPGGQQRLGQREERIAAPVQAGIEIIPEVTQRAEVHVHARKCAIAAGRAATRPSPEHRAQLNHKLNTRQDAGSPAAARDPGSLAINGVLQYRAPQALAVVAARLEATDSPEIVHHDTFPFR